MSAKDEMMEALLQADVAVDTECAVKAMEEIQKRLDEGRQEGKTQWWNPVVCPRQRLIDLMVTAFLRKDAGTVMVYAAMLVYRENHGGDQPDLDGF